MQKKNNHFFMPMSSTDNPTLNSLNMCDGGVKPMMQLLCLVCENIIL